MPRIAGAQTATTLHRIGVLGPGAQHSPAEIYEEAAPLRKLGWVEGVNLVVERRYVGGNAELLQSMAEELVRLRVELIVSEGTAATAAARKVTSTIPIVFATAGDPVLSGLVASLARPGGNVTGFSIVSSELEAKGLSVMREMLPSIRRVGILVNPTNPYNQTARKDLEEACRSLGLQLIFVEVAPTRDFASAINQVVRQGGQALVVPSDIQGSDDQSGLLRMALQHKLPTLVGGNFVREMGALFSYTVTVSEIFARSAAIIDKILRGARPADIPVEQPTKFALVINLETAKALGLAIPQSLLLRADEVIQ